MKRVCLIIVAAILLVSVLGMGLSASAITKWMRGDADGDDDVTIVDASSIQRKISGSNVEVFRTKAADVDNSGEIEITDATWIQRYLAGHVVSYKIGELFDPYELPFIPKQ